MISGRARGGWDRSLPAALRLAHVQLPRVDVVPVQADQYHGGGRVRHQRKEQPIALGLVKWRSDLARRWSRAIPRAHPSSAIRHFGFFSASSVSRDGEADALDEGTPRCTSTLLSSAPDSRPGGALLAREERLKRVTFTSASSSIPHPCRPGTPKRYATRQVIGAAAPSGKSAGNRPVLCSPLHRSSFGQPPPPLGRVSGAAPAYRTG
jgi:hypothetical protein